MLEQFLPSVMSYSPEATIYLADNASTDSSVTFVKSNFPTVQVIENKENSGFAGGYNQALKEVEADIYALVNSDIEVTENWLKPILKTFENEPRTAIIQPKILDFKNKIAKRISSKKYTIGEYVNLDNVLNYTFDDYGNMWCGTANSGILIINMTSHKTLSHINNLDDYTTISNNSIRFINTDNLGNIWAFTGNNNFQIHFKYSQNFIFRTWSSLNVENTDASSRIVPIEQMNSDNKGKLYMANKYGVSVLSNH